MSAKDLAARGPVMAKLLRFVRASALQHHVAVLPPHLDKAAVMDAECARTSKPGNASLPEMIHSSHGYA